MSEVDRSLVERGAIHRSAEAIRDGNPSFNDPAAMQQDHADLVAPPRFATSACRWTPRWIANLDRRRIVAGTMLTCRMRLRTVEDNDNRPQHFDGIGERYA